MPKGKTPMPRNLCLILLSSLLAAGCSPEIAQTCDQNCGVGDGGSGGDGGGGGGGGGGAQAPLDAFACDLSLSCEPIAIHIGPEPRTATECAGALIYSGTTGVLSTIHVPGPDFYQYETLYVLLGDGNALTQSRFRYCSSGSGEPLCPDPAESLPWQSLSKQLICPVSLFDESIEAACANNDTERCAWATLGPDLENCTPVESKTCAEIEALLN
jgi:hypothetical protein